MRVRSGRFNKSARSTKRFVPSIGVALGLAPIHPASGAHMNAQLDDAFAQRFTAAGIAGAHLPQADADARRRDLVTQ